MKIKYAIALLATLLVQISTAQVVNFVRCPRDICYPLSSLREAFTDCAPFATVGCEILDCEDSEGFRCDRLPENEPEPPMLMPGGEIVFSSLGISDNFTFMVNLSVSPLKTDFYLLTDATGSIADEIENVQAGFTDILSVFSEDTDAAFGIGYYRDEESAGTDNGFRNLQSITTSIPPVEAAVAELFGDLGGDNDEANLVALYRLATDSSIGWRDGSRRIVAYYGDFPGHEPTCVDGKELTRANVIEALQAQNITVVAVSFEPGLDRAPMKSFGTCSSAPLGRAEQATAITSSTGGRLLKSSSEGVVEAIQEVITDLDRTFDLDLNDCADKLTTTTDPTLPLTLRAGTVATLEQKVKLNEGVCTVGISSFECDLRYTESGAFLPSTKVTVLDIVGCPVP